MTDLGFGMADKRSVLIALFVFAMSSIYFQYPLPIDTNNVVRLFLSLLVLTGFIFIVRNIWRILLVTVYFILRVPVDMIQAYLHARKESRNFKKVDVFIEGLTKSIDYGLVAPVRFDEWSFDYQYGFSYRLILGSLGILDRAILILTAFVATTPQFITYRTNLGFAGIALMLVIYIFSGKFSLMLKDAIQKSKEDHDRLVDAASSQPNIYYPSSSSSSDRDYGGGL